MKDLWPWGLGIYVLRYEVLWFEVWRLKAEGLGCQGAKFGVLVYMRCKSEDVRCWA